MFEMSENMVGMKGEGNMDCVKKWQACGKKWWV